MAQKEILIILKKHPKKWFTAKEILDHSKNKVRRSVIYSSLKSLRQFEMLHFKKMLKKTEKGFMHYYKWRDKQ